MTIVTMSSRAFRIKLAVMRVARLHLRLKSNGFAHLAPSWLWLFLPFAIVGLSVAVFVIIQPITVLPRITLAPGFHLLNAQGERVGNEDLRGMITLYSFSYTDCDTMCTQSADQIAKVRDGLNGRLTTPLSFITISLTPEKDTPEQLQTFTAAFTSNNNAIQWQWLTGDAQRVRATVGGGFDLYYTTQPNGSVKFQPRYVLVDKAGVIRARYFTAEPDNDLLVRDIHYLTQEAENSAGAQTVAYEAAHLFLCYPR